jgi:hypothetical protein
MSRVSTCGISLNRAGESAAEKIIFAEKGCAIVSSRYPAAHTQLRCR